MNSVSITTDSSAIDSLLNNLDNDERIRDIMFKSITAGANVLRESTMQHMRSSWSASSHYSPYVGGPIYEGVRIKKDKGYNEVIVDILGGRSTGDYRIRFYERPIRPRYTKKGAYRGTLPSYHFFADARNSSSEQINEAICQTASAELSKLTNINK